MIASIKKYFLTGLMVLTPIALTLFLITWIVSLIDTFVAIAFPKSFSFPGSGLLILLIICTVVGFITRHLLGHYIFKLLDRIADKIPIIKSIYSTIKQIVNLMVSNDKENTKKVVLVEYPKEDSWVLAFMTKQVEGKLSSEFKEKMFFVFVPTTPNPTSGFLLMVPQSKLKLIDISSEEAIKIIISAGAVQESNDKKIMIAAGNPTSGKHTGVKHTNVKHTNVKHTGEKHTNVKHTSGNPTNGKPTNGKPQKKNKN